ncbi:MAG: dimethyl sulfoxide reductase anchor subunit [Alphaproteobacteria bacterium]|nr:dimethyl sulfoxide reductase anchor subunit [Alphaproteobacteria bacterium]MBO6862375.1 dimethyl sulfoxide reductase anchor subunit [Alphaproteobacteria bacterium]
MHPAKSVIFFTTASGAGYGLFALFVLMDLAGLVPPTPAVTWTHCGLSFALIVAGLLSSTFHLGHPERAWRALSQWRSSWLSREGVMAIISFGPMGAYALARLIFPDLSTAWQPALGGLAIACAVLTVYCTAMIYGSLKTIPAWSNPVTPVGYLAMAAASGAILLNAIAFLMGFVSPQIVNVTAILLLIAMAVKMIYWRRIRDAAPRSTAESATGLGDMGKVHLFETPHDGDNYLMTEMGFRIARKHAFRLRRIALMWGFLFPLLSVTAAGFATGIMASLFIAISVVAGAVGLLAERFLFFAEAKHTVMLYYGDRSV